jgi:hypothetical protein
MAMKLVEASLTTLESTFEIAVDLRGANLPDRFFIGHT